MSTTLRDALAELVALYDQRIPLRERPEAWAAARAALAQSDVQPVAVGWFESPHGAFRANPDYRLDFPSQLLKWSVPVYLTASPQEAPAQPVAQVAFNERGFPYDVRPYPAGPAGPQWRNVYASPQEAPAQPVAWRPLVEPSIGGRCASGDSTSAKPEPQRFPSPSEQPRAAGLNQCAASPREALALPEPDVRWEKDLPLLDGGAVMAAEYYKPETVRAALAAQAEAHAKAPEMAQAVAAADNTLHGAIDYWQNKAGELRTEVEAAIPAMREYARENPIWNNWSGGVAEPIPQDPNGVHAWLDRNDAARAQGGTST